MPDTLSLDEQIKHWIEHQDYCAWIDAVQRMDAYDMVVRHSELLDHVLVLQEMRIRNGEAASDGFFVPNPLQRAARWTSAAAAIQQVFKARFPDAYEDLFE